MFYYANNLSQKYLDIKLKTYVRLTKDQRDQA